MKSIEEVKQGDRIDYRHKRSGKTGTGHVQMIGDYVIKISGPPITRGVYTPTNNHEERKNKGSYYFLNEIEII